MIDDTGSVAGIPAPDPKSQIPPINEPTLFGESPDPGAGSAFEKVKRATKSVFEKHGVMFRRGGGRPRKDGMPNKLDFPLNAAPTALPAGVAADPAPPPPGLDPALVKKCCGAVIKAFKGFFDKILFHKARRKFPDDPAFVNQLVIDTTITQEETDGFAELAEICLRKYGVGTEYAPEIGLGAIVLGVGLRYTAAFRALEPEKKKAEPSIHILEKKP